MKKLFVAAMVLASSCFGAPNPTGAWKLNLAKSQYGAIPAPVEVTRKVILDGINLWMSTQQKTAQRDSTSELKYTTDGKVCINKVTNGDANKPGRLMLSRAMMSSVAAFAKSGNPNNPALGTTWPAWPQTLIFDATLRDQKISIK